MASRRLRIDEIDAAIDDELFAMLVGVEDTKELRGVERFDDPTALAASVSFGVYALDPAPSGTAPLCMRQSASSARITYLTGFQTMATGRLVQPFTVMSVRRKSTEPESPGES